MLSKRRPHACQSYAGCHGRQVNEKLHGKNDVVAHGILDVADSSGASTAQQRQTVGCRSAVVHWMYFGYFAHGLQAPRQSGQDPCRSPEWIPPPLV